jgi:chromosome segregation ATPase
MSDMIRRWLLILLAAPAFAQTTDGVLTQTLINEIRALRQQLEATNITSQRVQIALFRLQSQTTIVNTAQQRMDAARAHLVEAQNERQRMAGIAHSIEEQAGSITDPNEKKAVQQRVVEFKVQLESVAAREASLQSAAVDAESQLRSEQARLSDLQSLLDRLDKALGDLASGKR